MPDEGEGDNLQLQREFRRALCVSDKALLASDIFLRLYGRGRNVVPLWDGRGRKVILPAIGRGFGRRVPFDWLGVVCTVVRFGGGKGRFWVRAGERG